MDSTFKKEDESRDKQNCSLMSYFDLNKKNVDKKKCIKKQLKEEEEMKKCTFKPFLGVL